MNEEEKYKLEKALVDDTIKYAGIKLRLCDEFVKENNSKHLKSKEETIKLLNAIVYFGISVIHDKRALIKQNINIEDILFSISDLSCCVIIAKNDFLLVQGGFGSTCYKYDISKFGKIGGFPKTFSKKGCITIDNEKALHVGTTKNEMFDLFEKFKLKIKIFWENKINQANQQLDNAEKERVEALTKSQNKIIKEFDVDGNGEVDVIEGNDFDLLLKKHQKQIKDIDRKYIQDFVKISNHLKRKKSNIQLIFDSIKQSVDQNELDNYTSILKNLIHNYNLVLFNSLNMITSVVNDDLLTFYDIHDKLDKLNIFNSNYENEVSNKLSDIGDGLKELMYSINDMNNSIVTALEDLSYVTEASNQLLVNELHEVNSGIKVNNLLSAVQTYQMYKINKNTKSLS
jgi:DNA-binding Lrp family transcriptional regulator